MQLRFKSELYAIRIVRRRVSIVLSIGQLLAFHVTIIQSSKLQMKIRIIKNSINNI